MPGETSTNWLLERSVGTQPIEFLALCDGRVGGKLLEITVAGHRRPFGREHTQQTDCQNPGGNDPPVMVVDTSALEPRIAAANPCFVPGGFRSDCQILSVMLQQFALAEHNICLCKSTASHSAAGTVIRHLRGEGEGNKKSGVEPIHRFDAALGLLRNPPDISVLCCGRQTLGFTRYVLNPSYATVCLEWHAIDHATNQPDAQALESVRMPDKYFSLRYGHAAP